MEFNVSRTGKYVSFFANKGGCWFSVNAEVKGKNFYISSVSGGGAGHLFRPVFRKVTEAAAKMKMKHITTDLIKGNEKLAKLAKRAGFRKARVRSALGMGYDRSRKAGATPMYLPVSEAQKILQRKK